MSRFRSLHPVMLQNVGANIRRALDLLELAMQEELREVGYVKNLDQKVKKF